MTNWTEKYRPRTLDEVRGNDKARDKLREWAQTWDEHQQAVILYGSPGVGKTSGAHALANEMGWAVMELNASDSRKKDVIDRIAGEASKTGTLGSGGSGRRLIILDEADNFHGSADYGGARAVTSIVKEADQPIILIANEYYEMSRGLRNACKEIEFRDISSRSVVPVLRDICRKEGVEFEQEALEAIADRSDGDLRSAINDLEVIAEGKNRVTETDVVTDRRDTTMDIFPFVDAVLQESSAQGALQQSYDVDETPDDLIQWIEENVPKEYDRDELADAYGHLAVADRWLGRVRATQNYSFWRYATDAMVAGVAASRKGQKGGWTRYSPPSYRSKLGRNSGHRNTRDEIARRIAEIEGTSIATTRRVMLPYLAAMIHHCRPREMAVEIAAAYELDESELSFITGSGEDTNKVQSIIKDAAERREEKTVEASSGAFEAAEKASTEPENEQTEEKTAESEQEDEPTDTTEDTTDQEQDEQQSGLGDFF